MKYLVTYDRLLAEAYAGAISQPAQELTDRIMSRLLKRNDASLRRLKSLSALAPFRRAEEERLRKAVQEKYKEETGMTASWLVPGDPKTEAIIRAPKNKERLSDNFYDLYEEAAKASRGYHRAVRASAFKIKIESTRNSACHVALRRRLGFV